jgi:hypothetical protein
VSSRRAASTAVATEACMPHALVLSYLGTYACTTLWPAHTY